MYFLPEGHSGMVKVTSAESKISVWLSLAHCGCILYDVATLVYYSLKDTVLMHSENS